MAKKRSKVVKVGLKERVRENWDGILGLLVAIGFSVLILSVAFDHNPQGEFFDSINGKIQLGSVLPLFFLSFVESFVVVFVPIRFLRMVLGPGHH